MSELFDFADGAAALVGLIITIFGTLVALISWFKRRADMRVDERAADIKKDFKTSSDKDRSRLGRVEHDIERLDGKFKELDVRVREGFRDVDDRLNDQAKTLITLATKDDLTKVQITQAGMDSRLSTLVENDRRLLEMLTGQGRSIASMFEKVMNRLPE